MEIRPIAHIESGFSEKFGVPRQSSLAGSCRARIVFEPEFRSAEAVRGLEGFEYIWLIWEFSENGPRWQPTVRPPRLGGNRRMGVFATRSTFRPNALGLSSVRLEAVLSDPVLGPVLLVGGADLVDGTPIYDIKPYITYADAHPGAASGWVDEVSDARLTVQWADLTTDSAAGGADSEAGGANSEAGGGDSAADSTPLLSGPLREELTEILSLDPRPRYIDDPDRVYGLSYSGLNVTFRVAGNVLSVISIEKI